LLAVFSLSAAIAVATVIEPLAAGPFAVGSTNFEANEPADAPMQDYLIASSGWLSPERYVAQLLKHPEAVFRAEGRTAKGEAFPVVCYVFYPTPADNARPAHTFPYTNTGDNVFPHMQRPGEQPLFAEPGRRWPVVVASHGYNAHGLWEVDRWKRLASHGYIVVSIFHGDGRWSWGENHGRRPAAVKAVLDRLLGDPAFAPAIDAEHIGASGSSFGAYTILACLGASDPTTGRAEYLDARLKAGFALVPYAGGNMGKYPFGENFAGLRTMTKPYLALYGGDDRADYVVGTTAQCGGETMAVMLPGEKHLLTKEAWNDVPTWEILFFNAWLKGDAQARELLAGDLHIRGGVDDHVTHRNGRAVAR
jgi:predicted dienelactone hydrolase